MPCSSVKILAVVLGAECAHLPVTMGLGVQGLRSISDIRFFGSKHGRPARAAEQNCASHVENFDFFLIGKKKFCLLVNYVTSEGIEGGLTWGCCSSPRKQQWSVKRPLQ